ncbi:MAG: GGDEF domain-containing protein [Solirubrobacteraceae bacterium]
MAEVAQRLAASARSDEVVARVGGEEFALLMPDTDAQGAMVAAERARLAIAGRPFEGIGDTVSVGVCALEDAPAASELVQCADMALYTAKHMGRNRSIDYAGLTSAGSARVSAA